MVLRYKPQISQVLMRTVASTSLSKLMVSQFASIKMMFIPLRKCKTTEQACCVYPACLLSFNKDSAEFPHLLGGGMNVVQALACCLMKPLHYSRLLALYTV